MSTILNNSGVVYPDSTTQTAPANRTNSNIPVFSMFWNNSGASANNYSYNIAPNTMTKLTINAVSFDSHNGANTANSSYSVPYSGIYRINPQVVTYGYPGTNFFGSNALTYFLINLYVNGSLYETVYIYYGSGSPYGAYNPWLFSQSCSTLMKLNAGDSISIYAQGIPYSTGNVAINATILSGHLVN